MKIFRTCWKNYLFKRRAVISSGIKSNGNMHGDLRRKYMIVVGFPSEEVFQGIYEMKLSVDNIHHLEKTQLQIIFGHFIENWNI